MLCIEKIRFWCKIEGFLDRINAPETVIKIVLDDNFALPQLGGTTKQNTTDWQEHQIPPIELSPYKEKYKIQFAIYRDGALIGTGSTSFGFTETRKDCLDIVDKQNRISGKLVYELNWIKSTKTGSYITYQQFSNFKTNAGLAAKEPIIAKSIPTERTKKYVRQEGDQNCGCFCLSVRKKKPKKIEDPIPPPKQINSNQRLQPANSPPVDIVVQKVGGRDRIEPQIKFIHNPFVYFEEQLPAGKINEVQQLNRLNYYSKTFVISK